MSQQTPKPPTVAGEEAERAGKLVGNDHKEELIGYTCAPCHGDLRKKWGLE